jgi:hypothetical protein
VGLSLGKSDFFKNQMKFKIDTVDKNFSGIDQEED